jgi:hypothetical protein
VHARHTSASTRGRESGHEILVKRCTVMDELQFFMG